MASQQNRLLRKFFAEWKDADADIPALQKAREQYAALTSLR